MKEKIMDILYEYSITSPEEDFEWIHESDFDIVADDIIALIPKIIKTVYWEFLDPDKFNGDFLSYLDKKEIFNG